MGLKCQMLPDFIFGVCLISISFAGGGYNSFSIKDNIYLDAGEGWESLTFYKSTKSILDFDNKHIKKTNPSLNLDIGLEKIGSKNIFFGDGAVTLKNLNFSFSVSNYISNPSEINFTTRNKTDMRSYKERTSSFGFKNSWVLIQICKGRENWGAGSNMSLALSDKSSVYNYITLGSNYGSLRVKYIYGTLEEIDHSINRFITARGIEWTDKNSLIIGLSETVVYSGENRSFDIAYLNPISSHLEVELNERLNHIGNQNSNAVWQLHLDKFFRNSIRLSLNYLLDEFVLDPEIEIQKEHGKAFSSRIAYTKKLIPIKYFTIYTSFLKIGTPTFRHISGYNNFVNNGLPLGWHKGSDTQETKIGFNINFRGNSILQIYSGLLKSGDENINYRAYEPYKDYQEGKFPSGKVEILKYYKCSINSVFYQKYSVFLNLVYFKDEDQKNNFSLNSSFLFSFSI